MTLKFRSWSPKFYQFFAMWQLHVHKNGNNRTSSSQYIVQTIQCHADAKHSHIICKRILYEQINIKESHRLIFISLHVLDKFEIVVKTRFLQISKKIKKSEVLNT